MSQENLEAFKRRIDAYNRVGQVAAFRVGGLIHVSGRTARLGGSFLFRGLSALTEV